MVYRFKEYNAEWDLRSGYGYYSAILPRELAKLDARDWRNMVGTGPFLLTRFVEGSSSTYERNPNYWDHDLIGGRPYAIPYVDRVIYRTIKDAATQQTALRTAKIDILEVVPWLAVDYLKETTPELQWTRYLGSVGEFIALRVDRKPFDDVRVRRALNMAIDKREIVEHYYGGNAELFGYPMHPDFKGYYQPLQAMPPSVKELFTYDPVKAKRLLAEAGYPNGFRFPVQFAAVNYNHADLLPLIAGYLAKSGRHRRHRAARVRRLPVGDDHQDARRRLPLGQRRRQSHHQPAQELQDRTDLEPVDVVGPRVRSPYRRRGEHARRARATTQDQGADRRDAGSGAVHLAADGLQPHRLVAVGEELRRRAARRRGAAGADLRADLDRPRTKEESSASSEGPRSAARLRP